MSAAEAARVGTGLAFVVMPLVFVFAFATHPGLLRPRVLGPEQLIDRSRGRRLLHAGHGLVTLNTGLMIVVALYLGRVVTTHGAGWAGLVGTLLAVLGTVCLAADKGALCLTMSALDGLSDDEFAAARPALSAIFAKKGWLWLLLGHCPNPHRIRCAGHRGARLRGNLPMGGHSPARGGAVHRIP